jgi:hypothetical protein
VKCRCFVFEEKFMHQNIYCTFYRIVTFPEHFSVFFLFFPSTVNLLFCFFSLHTLSALDFKSQVDFNVALVISLIDGNRSSSLELLKIFISACFSLIVKHLTVLSRLM